MKILSVSTYAGLRSKVREVLLLGRQKIEAAKIRAYWDTGSFINQHIQVNGGRAGYGQKIIRRLAEDIELHFSVLQKCSQFAEMFPDFRIVSARRQLTWAHFRALLTVPDEKKRLALMERAEDEHWASRDLEIEVRNLNWEVRAAALDGKPSSLLPEPALGSFFTYKILQPETDSPKLLIDLGFSCYRHLDVVTSKTFANGDRIESVKTGDGQYKLQKTVRTADALYVYCAQIEKIVDGDTLRVVVDLGFDTTTRQYIRLRAIDCPEMDTPEGRAAKRFVERELSHCEFITVKSIQARKEKWGRYLGDVFYIDKTGKQVYLNNLLLEKGYAVRIRE